MVWFSFIGSYFPSLDVIQLSICPIHSSDLCCFEFFSYRHFNPLMRFRPILA